MELCIHLFILPTIKESFGITFGKNLILIEEIIFIYLNTLNFKIEEHHIFIHTILWLKTIDEMIAENIVKSTLPNLELEPELYQ